MANESTSAATTSARLRRRTQVWLTPLILYIGSPGVIALRHKTLASSSRGRQLICRTSPENPKPHTTHRSPPSAHVWARLSSMTRVQPVRGPSPSSVAPPVDNDARSGQAENRHNTRVGRPYFFFNYSRSTCPSSSPPLRSARSASRRSSWRRSSGADGSHKRRSWPLQLAIRSRRCRLCRSAPRYSAAAPPSHGR